MHSNLASILDLTNLILRRLNLLSIGFDKLITVRDSLFRVADITCILLKSLLNNFNGLEVVVLALLILLLELHKVGLFRLCILKVGPGSSYGLPQIYNLIGTLQANNIIYMSDGSDKVVGHRQCR